MLQIYGSTGCGTCIQAKQFCETKALPYIYYVMGVDYQLSDFMKLSQGKSHKTYPLILDDGEYLGTLADLKEKYK